MNLLLWVLLILAAVLTVRNEIIYRISMRRTEAIHALNTAAIDREDYTAVKSYNAESLDYDAMLFDLTRWTYRQFYPEDLK